MSTISGLYNSFTSLEEQVCEQNSSISAQECLTGDLSKRLVLIEQSISDNDISTLQGKLAELSTNLVAIMEAQKELMDLKDRFKDVEVSSKENVLLVDSYDNRIKDLERKIAIHQREVDDIWKAMDAIANPLG
jgi:chromosome segregation ATPase